MKRSSLLLIIVLSLYFSTPAFAEFKPSPWTTQSPYAEKISHKLGFGFLNFATGWTALFWEPSQEGNKWVGIGRGILYTITNTAGGALHAITFPIPIDIPLPEGGVRYES